LHQLWGTSPLDSIFSIPNISWRSSFVIDQNLSPRKIVLLSIPNIYIYFFFLIYIYMNKSSTNRGFLHTAQITIGEIPWKLTFSMTIGSWMVSNPHFTKRKPRHFCNGIEGGYN
jgi:sensor histidine kinase YesM